MMAKLSPFNLFPQVVAMQLLYVLAIIAVFVLCIALLSTARRILRSNPLQSGQLALSSIRDFDRPEDDDLIEIHAVETRMSSVEAAPDEWDSDLDELPDEEEIEVSPVIIAETTQIEVASPVPVHSVPSAPIEDSHPILTTSETSEPSRPFHFHKPSRRAYSYALECLLIGVSAWVLIQTQRSNMQQRVPNSSRNRVA
ncbi:MAG TPA: hypothetical protein VN670_02295 [Acidobacteriaceae bacterium]|nr:hypothetical protein [Acidobacteriaceae bacterium]